MPPKRSAEVTPGRPKMEKWQVAQVWRAYLNREGPQNLGTVQWPEPKQGCLTGIKILSTGVFETIEREEMISLLTGCGARYYSGMSPHLDYLLVGRDAGPVKLQVASEKGIPQLSEAEFHTWIKDKIDNHVPSADDKANVKPVTGKKANGKAAVAKQPPKARKAPAKRAPPAKKIDYDSDQTSSSDDESEDEQFDEVPAKKKKAAAKTVSQKSAGKAGPVVRGKKAAVTSEPIDDVDEEEKPVKGKAKGVTVKKEKVDPVHSEKANGEAAVVKTEGEAAGGDVKPKRGRPAKVQQRQVKDDGPAAAGVRRSGRTCK